MAAASASRRWATGSLDVGSTTSDSDSESSDSEDVAAAPMAVRLLSMPTAGGLRARRDSGPVQLPAAGGDSAYGGRLPLLLIRLLLPPLPNANLTIVSGQRLVLQSTTPARHHRVPGIQSGRTVIHDQPLATLQAPPAGCRSGVRRVPTSAWPATVVCASEAQPLPPSPEIQARARGHSPVVVGQSSRQRARSHGTRCHHRADPPPGVLLRCKKGNQ